MKTVVCLTCMLSAAWVGWSAEEVAVKDQPTATEVTGLASPLEEEGMPELTLPAFEIKGLRVWPLVVDSATDSEESVAGLLPREPSLTDRWLDDAPSVAPGVIIDEPRRPAGRVLETPLWGRLSVLGSTVGGGVVADEAVGSVHDWKELPGLYAVPDHELAAGFSVPVGQGGSRFGIVYRTIQAAARWGTDHYWGNGAPPVRVEENQNHGVLLVFTTRF